MRMWTDDPIADASCCDDNLANLPACIRCGEPIMEEKAIYYNDQWCCRDCERDFWLDIREDFLEGVE